MNVEAVLGRLQGVQRNCNGWMALCPAHPDKNPSLSFREENGRMLMHCFAGCTPEAVCAALGIEMRELFSEPRAAQKPEPRIVRDVEEQMAGLRSRLTPRDRQWDIVVVLASRENPGPAFARSLTLAVEGELVQVAFGESEQWASGE
jgi:hypothetical protein